ncbi:MAG: permease-like cell division protein FtsX, partial [Tissierellales bacterium]
MKLRTWARFFKQGMNNIVRNRVMSLASITAIMSALIILGIVLVIVFNLNHMAEEIESKLEISVFLRENVSSSEIQSIRNRMENWEGVYEVEFISKEQALERWKQELGDKASLLEGYDNEKNPLPDTLLL